MKTRVWIALTVLALLLGMIILPACSSKPAKMSNLAGTYRLETFERSYSNNNDELTRDMMSEWNIENAYLVVTGEEYGYYVYVDKSGSHVNVVKLTYAYDDSEKVSEVSYTTGTATASFGPTLGKETLTVYYAAHKKTLSDSRTAALEKSTQSVVYSKVNKATDLSYINKTLKTEFAAAPYEVARLDGWQCFSNFREGSQYIYCYIDLYAAEQKADLYYALKADSIQHAEKDVDVTYTIKEDSPVVEVQIGDKTFYCTNNEYISSTLCMYVNQKNEAVLSFTRAEHGAFDFEMNISTSMADYASYTHQ